MGSGFYAVSWKRAVSRFGTKVIAVNRDEAYKSGVVAKPSTFKTQTFSAEIYVEPVCPGGYKSVSNVFIFRWGSEVDSTNRWKSGTLHCLKEKYVISSSRAQTKYGHNN